MPTSHVARNDFLIHDAPTVLARRRVLAQDPLAAAVVVGLHGSRVSRTGDSGRKLGIVWRGRIGVRDFNVSVPESGKDLEAFTEMDAFKENTIAKELQDLGRILDAVTHRQIDTGARISERLGLLGHSRGGGVALLRASRDPGCGRWSPGPLFPTSIGSTRRNGRSGAPAAMWRSPTSGRARFCRWAGATSRTSRAHGEAYSPIEAARRLRIPYLIVHEPGRRRCLPRRGPAGPRGRSGLGRRSSSRGPDTRSAPPTRSPAHPGAGRGVDPDRGVVSGDLRPA